MRIYTLLLGLLLTLGVALVAELAIDSAGARLAAELASDARHPAARGPVWYGGMLAPVTVQATRAVRPPATLTGFEAFGADAPCAHPPRQSHALAAE
jgi:hypothetical protein